MGARSMARTAVVVVALLGLSVGTAGACTTPNWVTVEIGETRGGTELLIDGGGYDPGPVDLRWGGMDGELLGTAEAGEDGRFTARAAMPDHEPGRHAVVAVQEGGETRLWGFTDLDLRGPAAPPAAGPPLALVAAAAAVLVLVAALLLVTLRDSRRRRRALAADEPDPLDGELAQLLEDEELVPR
jgi:hypothetical protein